MPRLGVQLLGGYRVDLGGEAVYGFETDKVRALLAYLVVEADRPHRRETLASLLWPDRPDAVARTNLRQTLTRLRRALRGTDNSDFLFITPNDVQFNAASEYSLDVADLEAFARSPARHDQLLPAAFCTDFLAGFAVPDNEAFQAWVLSKQEHYHRLVIEVLEEQNTYWESTGDYARAAAAAQLQIQLEPWHEEAHRRCMHSLALAGRREEALHQYQLCCRALLAELGVEPAASTNALYAEIRDGVVSAGAVSRRETRPAGPPVRPAGRLAPAARIVARDAELSRLTRYLDAALDGRGRVVLIGGDRGSGKSTLLEAFAAAAMREHPDLLVAGARCSPGGLADPYAPLRKLAEVLFGDLDTGTFWRIHDCDQVDRLRTASNVALAALREHGPGLIDTLVPASSIMRRVAALPGATPAAGYAPTDRRAWQAAPAAAQQGGPKTATLAPPGSMLDGLIATLAALSRRQPLLLLFDDLQWVDEGSAASLFRLGRDLAASSVLVLAAYRSGPVAAGRRDPRSGEVVRHPLAQVINELRLKEGEISIDLDQANGRAFVEAFLDTEPNRLGAQFRDALYAHTGGHALFTVEIVQNLQARGELAKDEAGRWVARERLDWGALPARVEAAIAERIERLPEVCRRLLSAASVEGDEFTAEVAAELSNMAVSEAMACLSGTLARQHRLVRPEALRRTRGGHRSVYRFTHHLFQKYLYDQLDPMQRAQMHGVVAVALSRQVEGDPGERERASARLAWHYESAGMALQAAQALYDAGRQAVRLSDFRDAISLFEHGLVLLATEPLSQERADLQGLLEVALLSPRRSLEGWGTASFQDVLQRARERSASKADGRGRLLLAYAEMDRLMAQGQYEDVLALVDQARAVAEASSDPSLLPGFLLTAGITHCHLGHVQTGLALLESVVAWQTADRCAELRQWSGFDVSVLASAWSGLALWLIGCGDRALARCRESVAAAEARGDALGLAFALAIAAMLHLVSGSDESAEVEPLVERLRGLATEHGFKWWSVYAEILAGRLLMDRGEISAGIEQMQGAGASWQGSGMQMGVPLLVVLIAEGCLRASQRLPPGQQAAREHMLESAQASMDRASQLPGVHSGWMAPELNRLRGELLLARGDGAAAPEALGCFRDARQLAHQQGELAWELRATLSLVRLLAANRRANDAELIEARDHLRLVCGMFAEGWSCSELQEAAALVGAVPPVAAATGGTYFSSAGTAPRP